MKITKTTKILLELKRSFNEYVKENKGTLISYKLMSSNKKLNLDFALDKSNYVCNHEIITGFIKKYGFEAYIKVESCQHIVQNNITRTIFTFEITNKAALHQEELCGLLMIK